MNWNFAVAVLLLFAGGTYAGGTYASGTARSDNDADGSLPTFDMDKHCARAMQGTWSLTRTHAGCVHAEQRAYDQLKTSWTTLDEQTRVYCGKVSRTVDNSYSTLQDCVKTESQSDDYEAHLQAMAQHSSAFRQAPPAR